MAANNYINDVTRKCRWYLHSNQ